MQERGEGRGREWGGEWGGEGKWRDGEGRGEEGRGEEGKGEERKKGREGKMRVGQEAKGRETHSNTLLVRSVVLHTPYIRKLPRQISAPRCLNARWGSYTFCWTLLSPHLSVKTVQGQADTLDSMLNVNSGS